MTTTRPTLVPLIAIALVLAPRLGAAQCPASSIALDGVNAVEHQEPSFAIVGGKSASYDLTAGTLAIQGHSGIGGSVWVEAVDRYRVVGLPDGTRVPLVARFEVHGYSQGEGCGGAGCWGPFTARIGETSTFVEASVSARYDPERVPLDSTLSYTPAVVLAGSEFLLRMKLDFRRPPGAAHSGGGSARLRFDGLPPGASVESCQGYAATTPARPISWGRIKAIYR